MEHLVEGYLIELTGNLRGFVFGFVHVGVLLLGYYSGWSINRLLKLVSNGYAAGIFGAALSHVIADLIASYLDPHMRTMILGIVAGGILPLFAVPFCEKYIVKSRHHIVVGDHEDVASDLKSHEKL